MPATVVLTQAAEGSDSLARELVAAGFHVERWPLTRLAPVAVEEIEPVLRQLADYDWIFLPSPSAVRLVAGLMAQLQVGWPAGARAGLIGPASVAAFRDCFGDAPAVDTPAQPPHDARHLVANLHADGHGGGPTLRALVLNRPDGRTEWIEALRDKAASVKVVSAYTAQALEEGPPPALMWHLERMQRGGGSLAWVVGAASQVDMLAQCLPQELAGWAKRQPVLVPHGAIREHALARGFAHSQVYVDRRDLVERLQYLGSQEGAGPPQAFLTPTGGELGAAEPWGPGYATEHVPPTDPAGKEGRSVLSLDQQKSSAIPGAEKADEKVTDAKVVSDSPPPAAPAPAASSRSSVGSAPPLPPLPPSAAPSPSPLPSGSPPGGPPVPPPRAPGPRFGGALWALLLLLLVGVLAAGGWWYTQQRFLAAERDGARRVQEAEARASRLEDQIKSLRESQNQLVTRSTTLETRLAESASQQEQLASLYDEIAKTRGDSALAEVEQAVTMANQHLELTGNVHAALLALQNAEQRLGTSEQSQAIGARRLILQDIERLKALPEVDLTRLAARLDDVINRVDRLPLLADANQSASRAVAPAATATGADAAAPPPAGSSTQAATSAPAGSADDASPSPAAAGSPDPGAPGAATVPAQSGASAKPEGSALERLYAWVVHGGARSLAAVREEFRSLVTIRRIDKPDSLLLSPDQKRAARENLKLLLLNARLNLLNRHESLFREDLGRAIDSIRRLTDTEQHEVKTAIATLQSLQSQPLELNLPSLSESLAAVRAARAASEKRS